MLARNIISEFYSSRLLEVDVIAQQDSLPVHSQPRTLPDIHNQITYVSHNVQPSYKSNASSQSTSSSESSASSKPDDQQNCFKASMLDIKYDKFMSFMSSMRKSNYYLYSLTFFSDSEYKFIEEHVGVICKCKIDLNYSFPLYEKENRCLANWRFVKKIEINKQELFLLLIYTDFLFNKLNERRFKEDEFIKKIKNEDYLICLLNEDNSLDMEKIQRTLSTKNYDNMNVMEYIKQHKNIKDCYALRTYGDENLRKYFFLYIYEIYRVPICLKEIKYDMTPLSRFNVKGFRTYADYYKEKYNINPKPDQPLISASNICVSHRIKNYAKNNHCEEEEEDDDDEEEKDDDDKKVIKKEKKGRNDLFIPELLVITHSRSNIDNLVFKLPTLLVEFEWAMKLEYLIKKYHFDEKAKDVIKLRENLRIALTPSEYNSRENYEVFETMGDKLYEVVISIILFHHHKEFDEGKLSGIRESITSNKYFSKKCRELKFDQLIKISYYPREWITPDLDKEFTIKFSRKTIADVIESITFALYKDSADLAVYFICSIMEKKDYEGYANYVKAVLNIDHHCHTTLIHENEFNVEEEEINNNKIENILDYSFQDKNLLYESFSSSIYHERLEYLGDAILDWVLFLDIYGKYKEKLTPLTIYDLRANLTSNEAQCYVFCSLGFHKVLQKTIADHSRIDEYIESLKNGEINFGNGSEFKGISNLCPTFSLKEIEEKEEFGCGNRNITWKVLSDTFEALIGAVLLDGGVKRTIHVVHRIMSPFLKKHMDIEKIKHHPSTNLQLYVQEHKMDMFTDCKLLSDNQYECRIIIDGGIYGIGKDSKKKEAIYKAYVSANRMLEINKK